MKQFRGCLFVAILLLTSSIPGAHADDYYQGKTLRFIVGSAAGGGYDAYATAASQTASGVLRPPWPMR